jgi:sugar lactone lactonase YvrE
MTEINFPSSPTNGQTLEVGNKTYVYNSTKSVWKVALNVIEAGGGIPITITDIVPVNAEDPNVTAVEYSATDSITVTGTGFDEVAFISIRGRYITGYTIVSDTEINITQIPSYGSDSYDIALLDENKSFAAVAQVAYNNERLVWSAQPASVYIIPDEAYSRSLKLNNSASFGETYSVSPSTPLPTGLTLSSGGVLSGTVAAADAGSYPITILAKNEFEQATSQSFTLVVRDKRWDVTGLQSSIDYGDFVSFRQVVKTQIDDYLVNEFQGSGYSDSNPKMNDITFSSAGRFAYTLSQTTYYVVQYYCKTPWDISTAVVVSSFNYRQKTSTLISGSGCIGIAFKPDGTKMYLIGYPSAGGTGVFEYSLSVPWMIETIIGNTSFKTLSGFNAGGTLVFKPEGDRVWIFDVGGVSTVRECNLTTNWDITTISAPVKSLSFNPGDGSFPPKLSINDDGTTFYYSSSVASNNTIYVKSATMSPAWTLPASASSTWNIINGAAVPLDSSSTSMPVPIVYVRNNTPLVALSARYFYTPIPTSMVLYSPRNMVKFRYVGADSIASGDIIYNLTGSNIIKHSSQITCFNYNKSSGKYYIVGINSPSVIVEYNSVDDLTPRSYVISEVSGSIGCIEFSYSGDKLFVLDGGSNTIRSYNLGSRYSLEDAEYSTNYNLNFSSPRGGKAVKSFQFSPDGTEILILIDDYIGRYGLTEAYNINSPTSVIEYRQVETNADSFYLDYQTKTLLTCSSSINEIERYTNLGWADLSYTNVIQLSINSTPTEISFNSDGTKMYISGNATTSRREITQFSLSEAWDTTTAVIEYLITHATLFGIAGDINGFTFSSDGTRIFTINNNTVVQYNLTVPWEIYSTVPTAVASYSVASQETAAQTLTFSADGTQMYIIGTSSDSVHQYALQTAWSISNTSFVRSFSVSAQDTAPRGIKFKPDGTTMYIVGDSGDDINQYSLTTPWDISTATFVQLFSVNAQESAPYSVHFKPDGTRMYVLGTSGDDVNEYTLSTPWDISTASFTGIVTSVRIPETNYTSVFFNDQGTLMFLLGSTQDRIEEWSLANPWQVSSARIRRVSNISLATQDTTPQSLVFSTDGTSMYMVGSGTDAVYQYSLTAPWNTAAPTFVRSFSVAAQETSPNGIRFKPDGTIMYVVGSSSDFVRQYSLPTAWDISTATLSASFSVNAQEGGAQELQFKPDGTRMYVIGTTGDDVNEYLLSTPWDISTASFVAVSQNLAIHFTIPSGLFIDPTGRYCYLIGSGAGAYDGSTAAYPHDQYISQLKFE